MKLLKSLRLRKRHKRRSPGMPTIVRFAGGMGTQILQAAVYFALKEDGDPVQADLSYFDIESRMAGVGEKGRATHWFWQLDQYGLARDTFDCVKPDEIRGRYLLSDGAEMMELGLKALLRPKIQERFVPANITAFNLPSVMSQRFLCIHVRRGDYVNVASHLIPDKEFIELARKFSGLVEHAVLLSDSPFDERFRQQMGPMFRSVSYLDKLDPYASHWLMRQARVLVCSNSTYSLTAAVLNPNALVVMPKRWFGINDQEIETPIQALCNFQVMG